MAWIIELIVAFFVLAGASFALIGSLGLARLPDFYMRLHAPTKSTTLGVGGTLIGSMIYFSAREPGVSVQEGLVVLFLFTTAPAGAYMLARAALHRHVPCVPRTRNQPWARDGEAKQGSGSDDQRS